MVIPEGDGFHASDSGCCDVLSRILTFVLIALLLEWVAIWPLKTLLLPLFPFIRSYCLSSHELSESILFLLTIHLRDGFMLSVVGHLMTGRPLYHISNPQHPVRV